MPRGVPPYADTLSIYRVFELGLDDRLKFGGSRSTRVIN